MKFGPIPSPATSRLIKDSFAAGFQESILLRLNELTVITEDVVEAARSTLVIGVT